MKKPRAQQHRVYDYHACRDWLQHRDGYDERDYAGKYHPAILSGDYARLPYQDFWQFVLAKAPSITNGSFFTMGHWWQQGSEPWQQEILAKYLDAFGAPDATGQRTIDFHVSW